MFIVWWLVVWTHTHERLRPGAPSTTDPREDVHQAIAEVDPVFAVNAVYVYEQVRTIRTTHGMENILKNLGVSHKWWQNDVVNDG